MCIRQIVESNEIVLSNAYKFALFQLNGLRSAIRYAVGLGAIWIRTCVHFLDPEGSLTTLRATTVVLLVLLVLVVVTRF